MNFLLERGDRDLTLPMRQRAAYDRGLQRLTHLQNISTRKSKRRVSPRSNKTVSSGERVTPADLRLVGDALRQYASTGRSTASPLPPKRRAQLGSAYT